jgi:hypothetical protein
MRLETHRCVIYGSALALAGLMAALCFLKPGATPWLPPCPFYRLTGLYCPGCGSTRMLYFLLHGHPWLAFRQNPLALIVLPAVLYGLTRQIVNPNSPVYSRIPARWGTAFLLVAISFGVARNLPFAPFCSLAPGGDRCGQSRALPLTHR